MYCTSLGPLYDAKATVYQFATAWQKNWHIVFNWKILKKAFLLISETYRNYYLLHAIKLRKCIDYSVLNMKV